MTILHTHDLTKRYGTTDALRGIDLAIPNGGVYGLVGPNGSGKTTALEIVVGLRKATSGRIEFAIPQETVSYCPDVAEFEPWLSAREVLAVAATLLGKSPNTTRINEILERVGLQEAANRRVGGFSRGMKSRLGIAAGLIGEPQLLIADEPAAALDPAGRWEIIDLLAELGRTITVLISSHDLTDIQRICHSIGILAKGKLVYQGLLSELLTMGKPTWQIIVRPPADRVVQTLETAVWVRSVTQSVPGNLTVEVTDPEKAELELPKMLAEADAKLMQFSQRGVNFQDIFFQMTKTGPFRDQLSPTKDRA